MIEQRGVYRVPSNVLDQVTFGKQVVEKIVEVPKPVNFVEKIEVYSSYSSALDTDSTWETEFVFSRYETYDIMHVNRVVKEQQIAGEETFCADQGVGEPSLLPCDGKAMLTKQECLDEDDWGFDGPVVDVDDESQVLVAKAMATIQGMQGFPPFPVLFEESTSEDMPVSALDDQLPQVGAMLLMDVMLKVAMQVPLCRLLQVALLKDNDVVESSLDNN
ncbi:hypothetical protein GOP47_0022187 [Adiantum capillus-veneris]|uniref:Uncharacterized protein n=1 Tax=Adiantum capillus-veneris TaxID=13818 RepID=A0A9D4Z7A6_ADICA|nr:hypothetical protein GOP47_0022187 [Adiantum capillus-veneris]